MNTLSVRNDHNQVMADVYRDNYKNVYYQVLSFVKNRETALDLTQDIFLKVVEQFSTFRGQSSLSTWLYAIAKNHCLEYLRRKKHFLCEITESENQIASGEIDMEEEIIIERKNRWVEDSMKDMNDPDTRIIFLKHKQNMSVKEIQDCMNISESAVKMRLQRARRRIASSYYASEPAA